MKILSTLCLLACAALTAQNIPAPTELPGDAFFIKKTWVIGGVGNWDYLTLDPASLQLFIAHGAVAQVVDVAAGSVTAEISGLRDAHAIALDNSGDFGYISDGPADQVKVFDRRSFKVVAGIPTGPNPRAIVLEPQTGLIFAVSADPQPQKSASDKQGGAQTSVKEEIKSAITVIDGQTRTAIGTILLPGKLGFAQAGGAGQVFVSIVDRNEIAWIDATEIEARLHGAPGKAEITRAESGQPSPAKPAGAEITLDWSAVPHPTQSSGNRVRFFALGPECRELRGLAVDAGHLRLFAACGNMKLDVLNAATGELVASLPTGPGTDAIGYDPDRGLIYAANGGANGSLTIIRQDVNDAYAVIQNLPTRQRARTLAVNPATGEIYLVTDLLGVNLTQPGGIGTLQTVPAEGSFQVLVIGH